MLFKLEEAVSSIAREIQKKSKQTEKSLTLKESKEIIVNYLGFKNVYLFKKYINETDFKDYYFRTTEDFLRLKYSDEEVDCYEYIIEEYKNIPPYISAKKLLLSYERTIDHLILYNREEISKLKRGAGSTEYIFPGLDSLYLRRSCDELLQDIDGNNLYRQLNGFYTTNFGFEIYLSKWEDNPEAEISIIKRFLNYIYNLDSNFSILFRDTDCTDFMIDYFKSNKSEFVEVTYINNRHNNWFLWNYNTALLIPNNSNNEKYKD